jgi:hypothetical protein
MRAAASVLLAALLAGWSLGPSGTEEGLADSVTPEEQVAVVVLDRTDKIYTDQVGDVSSFYRDVATSLAGDLSSRDVPATSYEARGARRLNVHLDRLRIDDSSSGGILTLRVRGEYYVETEGFRQTFSQDDTIQRLASGAPSQTDVRAAVASEIARVISADEDLLSTLKQ